MSILAPAQGSFAEEIQVVAAAQGFSGLTLLAMGAAAVMGIDPV